MAALGPRASAAFISKLAKDVRICPEGVKRAANLIEDILKTESFSIKRWKEHELNPKNANHSAVDWIFLVDTLNFSFWTDSPKYEVDYRGNTYTGYWALCAAVNRAMEEGMNMTSSKFFASVDLETMKRIFRSKTEREIPLLAERQTVLNETGKILLQKFSGSFAKCIEQCNHNGQQLLKTIVETFPSYRDEALYEGQRVSFYKRAQILIGDIWACFEGKDLGYFEDVNEITMFADYRIPQVLNELGVLRYSEDLTQMLTKENLLENGSQLEVEIRGCTVSAVELICKALHQRDVKDMNSILIDYCLWDYRRDHSKRLEAVPFHRTRCIFY